MEFGRVSSDELELIDFTLPADHRDNDSILSGSSNKKDLQIFIGCAKWGRKDWIGTIYPEKTKESNFLEHYARHFNAIELNATFYKIPTKAQTSAWRKKVGDEFLFCPKFSQSITHIRRLKNAQEVTERFLEGVSGFGKNLGPLFLMPHPQMGPKTKETILAFIEELPKDVGLFVELRHPDWFSDSEANNAIHNAMHSRRVGTVITDASGRRDCVHMRLTTPEVFIRFVGNGLHPTDYTRIDNWAKRICEWKEKGLEKLYFFMHQHEELHSPELARYTIQKLNEECKTSIRVPQF